MHQARNAHAVGQLPTHALPDSEAYEPPSPPLEIGFKCCQKSAWVSQSSFMRPAHEPGQRAGREIRPLLRRERGKATTALVHRTLRHIRYHTAATHAPCRFRPPSAVDELAVVPAIVNARRRQPSSDPCRHRHRHGVADQPPPVAALSCIPQQGCPPVGKPWKRSTASIGGVTTRPVGSSTAGGEGIPSPDPILSGGTASAVNPCPERPSVQ